MFISQDIFRGGNQWIVSFSPGLRVIFDGEKYSVGREGYDVVVTDRDKDGTYEITLPLTHFYGFQNLSPAATPLPTIIFKYNAKAREYLPANYEFRDYLLRDIEKQKAEISPVQDTLNNHLSDVMSITLDYIFAGEEQKAWTFFDDSYKLTDKTKIKADIKAELKDHPVYRFLYQKRSIH